MCLRIMFTYYFLFLQVIEVKQLYIGVFFTINDNIF